MRLQDAIMASRPFQVETTDGRVHDLPGACELSQRLAGTPLRYVLDDASVRLISETAFAERSMVGEAVDLLRIPAGRVWIEWSDRETLPILDKTPGAPAARTSKQIGILIESDDTGRQGVAQMAWLGDAGEAEVSPFLVDFNFDDAAHARVTATSGLSRYLRIRDLDALDPFFDRLHFRLAPAWERYYRRYCCSQPQFEAAVAAALRHVGGDFPFAAAFLLMLSTRSAFEELPSDLAKLNARRAKRGRPALLDHIRVSLNLAGLSSGGHGVGGGNRSAPRLHHVNGHLVRRGERLFWRRAHLRGNPQKGVIVTRTVEVHATPGQAAA